MHVQHPLNGVFCKSRSDFARHDFSEARIWTGASGTLNQGQDP